MFAVSCFMLGCVVTRVSLATPDSSAPSFLDCVVWGFVVAFTWLEDEPQLSPGVSRAEARCM